MKVQDENARRSSMLVVCRKISSAVWKIFSTCYIPQEQSGLLPSNSSHLIIMNKVAIF